MLPVYGNRLQFTGSLMTNAHWSSSIFGAPHYVSEDEAPSTNIYLTASVT